MQLATSIETDSGEMIVKQVSVPVGLEELMEDLTKQVLLKKPKDIYVFAAEYFAKLLELRDKGAYKGAQARKTQFASKQIKDPPKSKPNTTPLKKVSSGPAIVDNKEKTKSIIDKRKSRNASNSSNESDKKRTLRSRSNSSSINSNFEKRTKATAKPTGNSEKTKTSKRNKIEEEKTVKTPHTPDLDGVEIVAKTAPMIIKGVNRVARSKNKSTGSVNKEKTKVVGCKMTDTVATNLIENKENITNNNNNSSTIKEESSDLKPNLKGDDNQVKGEEETSSIDGNKEASNSAENATIQDSVVQKESLDEEKSSVSTTEPGIEEDKDVKSKKPTELTTNVEKKVEIEANESTEMVKSEQNNIEEEKGKNEATTAGSEIVSRTEMKEEREQSKQNDIEEEKGKNEATLLPGTPTIVGSEVVDKSEMEEEKKQSEQNNIEEEGKTVATEPTNVDSELVEKSKMEEEKESEQNYIEEGKSKNEAALLQGTPTTVKCEIKEEQESEQNNIKEEKGKTEAALIQEKPTVDPEMMDKPEKDEQEQNDDKKQVKIAENKPENDDKKLETDTTKTEDKDETNPINVNKDENKVKNKSSEEKDQHAINNSKLDSIKDKSENEEKHLSDDIKAIANITTQFISSERDPNTKKMTEESQITNATSTTSSNETNVPKIDTSKENIEDSVEEEKPLEQKENKEKVEKEVEQSDKILNNDLKIAKEHAATTENNAAETELIQNKEVNGTIDKNENSQMEEKSDVREKQLSQNTTMDKNNSVETKNNNLKSNDFVMNETNEVENKDKTAIEANTLKEDADTVGHDGVIEKESVENAEESPKDESMNSKFDSQIKAENVKKNGTPLENFNLHDPSKLEDSKNHSPSDEKMKETELTTHTKAECPEMSGSSKELENQKVDSQVGDKIGLNRKLHEERTVEETGLQKDKTEAQNGKIDNESSKDDSNQTKSNQKEAAALKKNVDGIEDNDKQDRSDVKQDLDPASDTMKENRMEEIDGKGNRNEVVKRPSSSKDITEKLVDIKKSVNQSEVIVSVEPNQIKSESETIDNKEKSSKEEHSEEKKDEKKIDIEVSDSETALLQPEQKTEETKIAENKKVSVSHSTNLKDNDEKPSVTREESNENRTKQPFLGENTISAEIVPEKEEEINTAKEDDKEKVTNSESDKAKPTKLDQNTEESVKFEIKQPFLEENSISKEIVSNERKTVTDNKEFSDPIIESKNKTFQNLEENLVAKETNKGTEVQADVIKNKEDSKSLERNLVENENKSIVLEENNNKHSENQQSSADTEKEEDTKDNRKTIKESEIPQPFLGEGTISEKVIPEEEKTIEIKESKVDNGKENEKKQDLPDISQENLADKGNNLEENDNKQYENQQSNDNTMKEDPKNNTKAIKDQSTSKESEIQRPFLEEDTVSEKAIPKEEKTIKNKESKIENSKDNKAKQDLPEDLSETENDKQTEEQQSNEDTVQEEHTKTTKEEIKSNEGGIRRPFLEEDAISEKVIPKEEIEKKESKIQNEAKRDLSENLSKNENNNGPAKQQIDAISTSRDSKIIDVPQENAIEKDESINLGKNDELQKANTDDSNTPTKSSEAEIKQPFLKENILSKETISKNEEIVLDNQESSVSSDENKEEKKKKASENSESNLISEENSKSIEGQKINTINAEDSKIVDENQKGVIEDNKKHVEDERIGEIVKKEDTKTIKAKAENQQSFLEEDTISKKTVPKEEEIRAKNKENENKQESSTNLITKENIQKQTHTTENTKDSTVEKSKENLEENEKKINTEKKQFDKKQRIGETGKAKGTKNDKVAKNQANSSNEGKKNLVKSKSHQHLLESKEKKLEDDNIGKTKSEAKRTKRSISLKEINDKGQIVEDSSKHSKEETPNLKKEEMADAVIKIQALWRGFHVRRMKKIGEIFGKPIEQSVDKIEDLKSSEPLRDKRSKSALKIQSLWRGYQVRKNIKDVDSKLAQLQQSSESTRKAPTDDDIMKAATKIQANIRGYFARKNLPRKPLTSITEENIDAVKIEQTNPKSVDEPACVRESMPPLGNSKNNEINNVVLINNSASNESLELNDSIDLSSTNRQNVTQSDDKDNSTCDKIDENYENLPTRPVTSSLDQQNSDDSRTQSSVSNDSQQTVIFNDEFRPDDRNNEINEQALVNKDSKDSNEKPKSSLSLQKFLINMADNGLKTNLKAENCKADDGNDKVKIENDKNVKITQDTTNKDILKEDKPSTENGVNAGKNGIISAEKTNLFQEYTAEATREERKREENESTKTQQLEIKPSETVENQDRIVATNPSEKSSLDLADKPLGEDNQATFNITEEESEKRNFDGNIADSHKSSEKVPVNDNVKEDHKGSFEDSKQVTREKKDDNDEENKIEEITENIENTNKTSKVGRIPAENDKIKDNTETEDQKVEMKPGKSDKQQNKLEDKINDEKKLNQKIEQEGEEQKDKVTGATSNEKIKENSKDDKTDDRLFPENGVEAAKGDAIEQKAEILHDGKAIESENGKVQSNVEEKMHQGKEPDGKSLKDSEIQPKDFNVNNLKSEENNLGKCQNNEPETGLEEANGETVEKKTEISHDGTETSKNIRENESNDEKLQSNLEEKMHHGDEQDGKSLQDSTVQHKVFNNLEKSEEKRVDNENNLGITQNNEPVTELREVNGGTAVKKTEISDDGTEANQNTRENESKDEKLQSNLEEKMHHGDEQDGENLKVAAIHHKDVEKTEEKKTDNEKNFRKTHNDRPESELREANGEMVEKKTEISDDGTEINHEKIDESENDLEGKQQGGKNLKDSTIQHEDTNANNREKTEEEKPENNRRTPESELKETSVGTVAKKTEIPDEKMHTIATEKAEVKQPPLQDRTNKSLNKSTSENEESTLKQNNLVNLQAKVNPEESAEESKDQITEKVKNSENIFKGDNQEIVPNNVNSPLLEEEIEKFNDKINKTITNGLDDNRIIEEENQIFPPRELSDIKEEDDTNDDNMKPIEDEQIRTGGDGEEMDNKTKQQPVKLIHSSEFHDSLTTGNLILDENQHQEQGTVINEEHLPLTVQLTNQATPGVQVLTSPPMSGGGDVDAVDNNDAVGGLNISSKKTAQASNKDVSPRITDSEKFENPPTTIQSGMDNSTTEKRNNISNNLSKKNMEVEAATKIQAGFRGYQVRKQLKNKHTSSGDGSNQRRLVRRKSSGQVKKNHPAAAGDLQERSAVKIQAGVRGFLVRRRQKKEKSKDSPTSSS